MHFEGEEEHPREIALRPSAVIAPKPNEFHQHFNSGKGPLRQLAFRSGPARSGTGYGYNPVGAAQDTDPNANGYKIAYERENPTIREEYYRRLQRSGVESRLPPLAQRPG
jgi:hypothetical protein